MSVKLITKDQLRTSLERVDEEISTVDEEVAALVTIVDALDERIDNLPGNVEVPTKVSDLENDSGFQTETDVAAAIAAAGHLEGKIVESVDAIDLTAEDAASFIYLVPVTDPSGNNSYNEYMVIGGALELIGNTGTVLEGALTETDVATDDEVATMLNELFGMEDGAEQVSE